MTARLSLHHKAEGEIYRMERAVKGAFYDFCHHFRDNPDHPGLDLKPLKGNGQIFRAKVNRDFRALLVRTGVDPDGVASWLVVALRDRKDVYEHLTVAINRITGEIEVVDLGVVGDSALRRTGLAATPEPPAAPLLSGVDADVLRGLGVAEGLIDVALVVTDSGELDDLVRDAPLLSKDVLYGLASGMSVADVRREITDPVEVQGPDPGDLAAAAARTPVTTIDDDIAVVLGEGDFRAWKVFLHPAQQRIVQRRFTGPARVSGGPGTGKTIVALHRVKHLARQLEPGTDRPILLTTFTKNLATDLRLRLESLLEPELLARVDVTHIDQLAARVISENASRATRRRIDDAQATTVMRHLLTELDDHRFAPEFLIEEWDQVVLGQGLSSRREYFEARRAGRGTSLTRLERGHIWKVLEQFTARLDGENLETWGQAAHRAARYEVARAESVTGDAAPVGESSGRALPASPLPTRRSRRGARPEPRALDDAARHGRLRAGRHVHRRRHPPAHLRQPRHAWHASGSTSAAGRRG